MDAYADVRNIPLKSVLAQLGYTDFKKRAGKQEWYGRCPFHDPKKNKTSFSFDERRFNCFSCGEHGSGSIDLVMKIKKIGFSEAVALLGHSNNQAHTEKSNTLNPNLSQDRTPKSGLIEVLENKPFAGTYEKFYVKSEWLKTRGLTDETLKLFGVGEYRNPSRKSLYTGKVLFRIPRFKDGACVGYLARTIDGSQDPKYIFPKGFAKQLELFGAWQLRQLAQSRQSAPASNGSGANASGPALFRQGFVVESPLCVMKYWQLGLYAVSPFGAFLSSEQVEIIRSLFRGVVFLPDRDKYDQVAKSQSLEILSRHLWLKYPVLPETVSDPEHLSVEQIAALVKS